MTEFNYNNYMMVLKPVLESPGESYGVSKVAKIT